MLARIDRRVLFLCLLLTVIVFGWCGYGQALACGSCGAGASSSGGVSSPPTIPVITASLASPVLANEAQYGRNLPGELVNHFQEYLSASHGDLYSGVFTTTGKLHLSFVDGRLPGDIPLQIVRTFDSGNSLAEGFSAGWSLNYFKCIVKDASSSTLTLSSSTGSGLLFTVSRVAGVGSAVTARYEPSDRGLLRCKNDVSIDKCHIACSATNWNPPIGPPEKDEPCDDEGGHSYWFNVCHNNSDTWKEWGQTVALTAESQTDPTPRPLWGYSVPCKGCYYADGIPRGSERIGQGFTIYVNSWEKCPNRAPSYCEAGIGHYYGHWGMINSCKAPSLEPPSGGGSGPIVTH